MSLKASPKTSPDSIAPTSPFSQFGSLSTSHESTSPGLITQATYKKPTGKHVTELSTSSAAGIAIAAQVTPERLARLLVMTGPLAIRHITSNLSKQVHGFQKLSLSKQRRLIMGCLHQGFEQESIVFEKIGWGQWRARQVEKEDFIKERNAVRVANAKVKENDSSARRESITAAKYELDAHDNLLKKQPSDYAIASDDELSGESDSDEALFRFDDEIPPLKLNPRLISPPINSSTSQSRKSSMSRVVKPRVKQLRSNSQTPTSPELFQSVGATTSTATRRHSSIRSTLTHEDSETDEEDWATIGALQLLKREQRLKPEEQDAAFALVNLRSL